MPKTLEIKTVDSSGRFTLGKQDAHRMFSVNRRKDGSVVLVPVTMIPEREKWLWDNHEALGAVKEGLEQSARGETKFLGSFSQYAEDEIED